MALDGMDNDWVANGKEKMHLAWRLMAASLGIYDLSSAPALGEACDGRSGTCICILFLSFCKSQHGI